MESLLAEIERAALLLTSTDMSKVDRLPIRRQIAALLQRIRMMEGKIRDPKSWQVLHSRADELVVSLEKFSN
jgi:hypothetical protein